VSGEDTITNNINLPEFESMFRDYFGPLCAYAIKYTKDLDTAKEVVHSVFVNIWEKRDKIHKDQNIRSYLYTSVYNRCLNFIRDTKKTVEFEDQYSDTLKHNDPENLEAMELQARIDAAIQSLPDRCREIFVLSRYEDMKYAGIAEKLGISVKTVEVQMSKALKLLRKHLAEFLTIIIILFFR
jgi:RNA polymerase sigma-70 factor (ECF subfamily)